MMILDREAVDFGEDCGKMLFLVGSEGKVLEYVVELRVGERNVVDDSAVC